MAIQSELLYREDLPVNLRISGLRDKIKTPEDYNQVLDALLKNTSADLEYTAREAEAQRQEYLASPIGQKYPDAPPSASSIQYPEVRAQRAAEYKNYVTNQLKEAGIDRPQPSPNNPARNLKPVTSQPPQVPLKPSYSSIEVATPKETKSDSPLLEDIPDLGLEQMPSLLQDDARPADPASKLTPPESYLSDYVANLGKGETPSDGTLLAGPGYIDEDDAFDNPYYTSPVPDLDDDSDFPDLGDLDLAQAKDSDLDQALEYTESNFQKLLNQQGQPGQQETLIASALPLNLLNPSGQQETALASAPPLMPPALQAAGAKDDSYPPGAKDLDLAQVTEANFQKLLNQPGQQGQQSQQGQQETAFAPALPFIPPAVKALGAAAGATGLLGASGALDNLGQNLQDLVAPNANVQEAQPADNVMGIFGLGKPKPGTPSKVRYPTKSPEDKLLEDLDKADEALRRQPRDTVPQGAEGKKRFPIGDQASAFPGPLNQFPGKDDFEQRIAAFRKSLGDKKPDFEEKIATFRESFNNEEPRVTTFRESFGTRNPEMEQRLAALRQRRDTAKQDIEGRRDSIRQDIQQRIASFRDGLLAQAKSESPKTRRGPRGERATFSPVERRRTEDKPFARRERKPVKEETRQTFDVQEKRLARASRDDYRRRQADPIDPMRRGAIFG